MPTTTTTTRGEAIRLVTTADTLVHDLWTDGSDIAETHRVDSLHHRMYDAWIAIAGSEHDTAARLAREVIAEVTR